MTTLFIIVALALAGVGVYITRCDPKWGTPILVGIAIITVLYLLWDHDPSRSQTVDPPTSSTTPAHTDPGGQNATPIVGSSPPPSTGTRDRGRVR